jgi:hypothetical protein
MTELRELFEMATKQMEPDQDSWRKQEERQHRDARRRKVGAMAVAAAIGIAALIFAIQASDVGGDTQPGDEPPAAAESFPALPPSGSLEPGRYVFSSSDPALDASHRITAEVGDGYSGFDSVAVTGAQGSVITLAVDEVYADPCRWQGSLVDRSAIASTDGVTAAIAGQRGLSVSNRAAVTVDGFDGTYFERVVPAQIDMSTCDLRQFRVYRSPEFGGRHLQDGQLQLLWIVDVDGAPLVIDATLDEGASAQVRAELERMVDSIRIDPTS